MVVVDEVYGAEGAVALYLPHHSADAVAVGGVIFRCHRHYVVAHSQELARLLLLGGELRIALQNRQLALANDGQIAFHIH